MGLEVGKATRSYLKRRRGGGDPERSMTFTMRITEGQHAKLKFLADRFDASKSAVAQTFLNSAMEDALRIVGSYDAEAAGDYEGISVDDHNPIIDGYVEEYRKEIQRIFDEESSSKTA
jgi:hypothetical protein